MLKSVRLYCNFKLNGSNATVAVVKKSMSLAAKDTGGKSGKNCRGPSILSVVVAIIIL